LSTNAAACARAPNAAGPTSVSPRVRLSARTAAPTAFSSAA
jgi:hypothetical protein